jgi:hypothetical protein
VNSLLKRVILFLSEPSTTGTKGKTMTDSSRIRLYDEYRIAKAKTRGTALAMAEIVVAGAMPVPEVQARYIALRDAEAKCLAALEVNP